MDTRQTLRFYKGLNDEQSDALFGGQLAFDRLGPPQKQHAVNLQGLIMIAVKRGQPILLGLVPVRQEVHAYIDTAQQEYSWPNRTGIAGVILNITSPGIFSD